MFPKNFKKLWLLCLSKKNINIIVIIPAMGHCHQIPRKFLRNLDGKPLIAYAIALARELTAPERIIVLNDDEEIDLIAKRHGVVSRLIEPVNFPRKFGDPPTLALLEEVERLTTSRADMVIWLGPSSPLLRSRDILEAMGRLEAERADAVFSVSEEPTRAWLYDRTYQPAFRETPNTAGTGLMHRETGAFFIMKRDAIGRNGYEGKKGVPFCLHESHALEINSFNEWWVAEKLLRRKQVLFVVAGYPAIGMGHVSRALMHAQELNNHEIQFLCTKESDLAVKHISENLYPTDQQNSTENLQHAVLRSSPDIVINDVLDTSEEYVRALKQKGISVINFEDEGTGAPHADLVINALYESAKSPNMLAGHEYFSLRSEFYSAPAYTLRERVENVLVVFGGTDSNNLTLRVTTLLLPHAIRGGFTVTLLTGPGYEHAGRLRTFLDGLSSKQKSRISYITGGTRQISEYMAKSDFAITSAGRTVFELASLRVPAIIIAANEREMLHTFGKRAGMVFLGMHNAVNDREISAGIELLCSRKEVRKEQSDCLARFDLTKGKQNVMSKISQIVERP